jgi:hypothetical protein
MKGRIFDPNSRRFLTPDPFVMAPFNPQGLNRYAYVTNNPLNLTDPSGFAQEMETPPPNAGPGDLMSADDYWAVQQYLHPNVTMPSVSPAGDQAGYGAAQEQQQQQQAAQGSEGNGYLGMAVSYSPTVQPGGFYGPGGDLQAPGNQNPSATSMPTNAAGTVPQPTQNGTASPAPGIGEKIVGTIILAAADAICQFAGCGVANAVAPGERGVPQMSEGEKLARSGLAAGSMIGVGVVLHTLGAEGAGIAFRLGHTFTKHGAQNTAQLLKEAAGSGRAVGQWLDNAAAERFIAERLGDLKNGARTFDLPPGLGRVINPDGTFAAANKARLVPSGSGVKTAFPLIE